MLMKLALELGLRDLIEFEHGSRCMNNFGSCTNLTIKPARSLAYQCHRRLFILTDYYFHFEIEKTLVLEIQELISNIFLIMIASITKYV